MSEKELYEIQRKITNYFGPDFIFLSRYLSSSGLAEKYKELILREHAFYSGLVEKFISSMDAGDFRGAEMYKGGALVALRGMANLKDRIIKFEEMVKKYEKELDELETRLSS
jgi:hypothetical protein